MVETTSDSPQTASETSDGSEFTVLAAQIAGAHGVTGNVRVRLIGANPENTAQSLQASRQVRAVKAGEEARLLTLRSLRRQVGPKGFWIAQFREIDGRSDAETLIGHALYITEAERAALPEGEYYVDDLLGLSISTDTGHGLGSLSDVLNTPANDVYVTDTGVMIPAVPDFIIGVDLEKRQILVRDVPGLREGT